MGGTGGHWIQSFLNVSTLSIALHFFGFRAVLSSVSCWGVSYCMAQVEWCFFAEFYFRENLSLNFLLHFLTCGRPLYDSKNYIDQEERLSSLERESGQNATAHSTFGG